MLTKLKEFAGQFLNGFFDYIRFYFLLKRLRRRKIEALWEASVDRLFFQETQKDQLSYDDQADRIILTSERTKPEDKKDFVKISEAEARITMAKAIKETYRSTNNLITQLKSYIDLLNDLIK